MALEIQWEAFEIKKVILLSLLITCQKLILNFSDENNVKIGQ